jgi:hypothetical protein
MLQLTSIPAEPTNEAEELLWISLFGVCGSYQRERQLTAYPSVCLEHTQQPVFAGEQRYTLIYRLACLS